ncbi:MAG: LysR family transcriptional regulator [Brevibacterium aurantiacum]|uniref:DNA-binding transcriptional regulator, LysR family n=1 Tax=Brevibacterium aurantiacum TaxID=273384 RepID=A0A2H1JKR5_BREAU|nr:MULTISPECIES: LysR family transcriptional regulator [Brevibacterium]AZT96212.1 LysR family transcriptional regulator [Brevibacterium aurantiacum]MDN5585680.1 LysR family transcriptional regulator [Brevibacterium sp.]MDN5807683.1 LysR family transcriptional regulator [Brevibacterium sp.]MDN5834138.1 LysR family transcriptional regulator [Brevibacterium sp.]MDN5909601.1 LysR family transcriptional regulator [Brevibacterium sp.]
MELRQLSAFIAVAEELHFGRAAENLHIAQPALSQLIRALEKELGVRLFERTTRRVRMTSSGEALLEPARSIENQVAGAKRLAQAAQEGTVGRVRVGFGGTSGYSILSLLAHEVAEKHPGISLELHPQTYSGEAALAVRDGEMDLAVISPPSPAGVDVHVIRQETVMVAVPTGHALAERAQVSMRELADQPFISYAPSHGSQVREVTMRLADEAGFLPRIAQEAPDPYGLLALVGVGAGIAIVVESSDHIRIDGVSYVPLAEGAEAFTLALGWRRNNPSEALARVLDIVREILPEAP